ncbi:MAG: TolC family protein [Thermoanaerobaculia bacterium]
MKFLIRCLIITCLTALPAFAQEPGTTTSSGAAQPERVQTPQTSVTTQAPPSATQDVENPNAMKLSLEDAIHAAVEQNLQVQLQSYDYRIIGQDLRASHGIFDWFTDATISKSSSKQPVVSALSASQSSSLRADFGVQQLIPTGGTYQLSFNNSRSSSNNQFTFFNPYYQSSLGLGLTQPLLRNFGVDVTERGIFIARNNLGISREQFRGAMINAVQAVEQSYLDLAFARQNLQVKEQSLALAQDQARITQIRIDVGAAAPLDILEPRVAIYTRQDEVIAAQAQVRAAEDRLRQLMNVPPSDWDRPIVTTDPVEYQPIDIDVDQAVQKAMQQRPEIEQASLATQNQKVQYTYARNQVLPKLDLNVNYGFSGVGPEPIRDPVTGDIVGTKGGYSTAFNQVTGFDYPGWTVGVNIGVPVMNIQARAEAKRAGLELDKSKTTEAQTKQTVAIQVRTTVRDIHTAAQQIEAAKAAREAAEQNLEAERKKYENGLSTNFDVLRVQNDLSNARSSELQALVSYEKSLAAYHQAIGDLLESQNIVIQEPEKFSTGPSRLETMRWLQYGTYSGTDEKK